MKTYNFLIVDDDPDDHEFISMAIKKVHPDANIKSFFDGVQLSTHWFSDSEKPDLILLDLNMRIVDGKTALQNILKDEVLKQVPVIILTTASGIETKEKYQKLGAKDFYTKPYSFQTMTQMIAEITEKWLNKSI
jgi:two-component system response regulator